MSTRLAESHIKPSGLPQYCSSCHNQNAKVRHVDFDAAVDSGWYGNDPATRVSMDDLIICETCIKEGAELIGMEDGAKSQARMLELENQLEQERQARVLAEEAADKAEDLMAHSARRRKE